MVGFLMSLVGNMLASFLFLFSLLFFFKPRVAISPFICKGQLHAEPGKEYYFIKVVNRSFFSAYDLKVEMNMVQLYPTPPSGMKNNRLTPLSLVADRLTHLGAYRPAWMRKEAMHCFRFRSSDNLGSILNDDTQLIRITVSAKHGLTGLTKVCEEEYAHPSQLRAGTFTYGTKFGYMS